MRGRLGVLLSCAVFVLWGGTASAQFMRLTTNNAADPTRLKPGTTIITITLDTNHDRNGSPQTCNSHSSALCGATPSATALDMFSYTLGLKAVGGTVTWGNFTPSDAAYVAASPVVNSDTEIEINMARPAGTVSGPGLVTLGTIPVTPFSGSPRIDVQVGPSNVNPFGFGTGFGTECEGSGFGNTYVLGDPSDPCGAAHGLPGDWFDWDGVLPPAVVNQPAINAPAVASATENTPMATLTANATDPDGARTLTITQSGKPADLTFTADPPGASPRNASISGIPGFSDAGTYNIVWTVTDDNGLIDTAPTTLTIANRNRSPGMANQTIRVPPGEIGDRDLVATDADGDGVTFSKASGPTFVTVTTINAGVGTATGHLHAAPSSADLGFYNVTVRVTDTLGGFSNANVVVNVCTSCPAPFLNPVANMTVAEGAVANQSISATIIDGAPVTYQKLSGPAFLTVTTTDPGTGNATGSSSGNIQLAPGFADAGPYSAFVLVTDGASSSQRSFTITVTNTGRPPILNPISNMIVPEGATEDQTISASDPDGEAVTFTKDAGPAFMTVSTTAPGTGTATGNIHLAPGFSDAGAYPATVRASDGTLADTKTFTITVCNACNLAPTLNQVSNMTVSEGQTADQTITGVDPDGNALSFAKVSGPIFMTVSTTSPTTGNIHLAPGFADEGAYAATVSASDGTLSSQRGFSITALNGANQCPTARPGGPYSGLVGVPITFNGTASSDPDGNPLSYAWDFDASNGIQVDASDVQPDHAYGGAGTFTVTLTVADNGNGDPMQVCTNSAATTATITAACDATVFNGYDTIRLTSGKPTWFGYVQPARDCYSNSDVIISTFVMKYAGNQIPASGKTSVGGDKSGDGVPEIKVSFSKGDLRTLFAGLPNGHNNVTVTLEANIVSGGKLSGTTQLDVVNGGSFSAPTVAPNPLNPQAILTYSTTREGAVRIDLFNVQGRLVRRLVDEPALSAGFHDVTIDGRGARGEKLPSGVYYIRGTSAEGEFKQLITILK